MGKYRQHRSKKSDEIWLLSYADLITNLLIFFIAILAMSDISRVRMEAIQERMSGKAAPVSLSRIQKELTEYVQQQGLHEVVSIERTDRGLEISLNSGVVFPVGSDRIEGQWVPVLDTVLSRLQSYAHKYEFAVEGHADNTPIRPGLRFQSNWELASARAEQVRIRMEQQGIPGHRLRVESYGDTRQLPKVQLENLTEMESKSRHRRVVIRVF
ncbi:OmpA/MotB family protein [Oligoflexus tunisiensis]|uniref:OmpA/MotB family protein n=1 Tax=Oligoflexus tunisiensis TaxID=708132 RepID=UPI00114D3879|nr:flagellar motor protein MotB [Oligoflexus tunisiensis]